MKDIKKWLAQEVPTSDLLEISDGIMFIPIEIGEKLLDNFDSWGTQNFNYYLYKGEGYGNLGVAASLELVVEYIDNGERVRRTFVGACNFSIKSIHPNTHFLATAKSECMKNAMSDIGKRLGRGLNTTTVPVKENIKDANGGVEMPTSFDNIKLKTNAVKI